MKNFVVYKSSAGSGKTFTLVKEYLRLALYDENKLDFNYKRILAITFTNKAAAEMKTRVIESLASIADESKDSTIEKLLREELNVSTETLKERARIVLASILHHYSDFSVGTIDSFTHKIVKTFAHDLDLPVNFNVELDTAGFYEKVIAALFSKVGEDEYISKLLKEYALTKAEDNAAWDPEKHIHEFSKLLLKEHTGNYLEKLKHFTAEQLDELRKQFNDFIYYYRNTLKSEAQKAIELIRSHQLTDNDFTYKRNGPQAFFKKCAGGLAGITDAEGARINDAIEKNKWADKNNPEKAQIIATISPQLNAIASQLIRFIREHYSYFSLCELLSKQMYPLMLLKKIEEISQEQKDEERLVFISEFNQKIFDIINNQPTPFIYERLGERYRHYLLDEFQDTSSLQWHNILPLLDNSLSNGWFNLIVGDGKQSIYRWRNANVKQFASLPEIENNLLNPVIEERAGNLQRNFKAEVLSTNFRSAKIIVDFNNAFFGKMSAQLLPEKLAGIYKDQEQTSHRASGGYISIYTGMKQRDELDEHTCAIIREKIQAALASGFSYRDIAILARRNYHGNLIADFLMREKIPVVSSDSLLLKNNTEINTLLCYLKYLLNKQDIVSAAAVFNYLFISGRITEQDFHAGLVQLSQNTNLFELFRQHSIDLPERELSLNNLFDNCIELIRAINLNEAGYQYIRFFLDEVNEFQVLRNSNISSFFDWWESRSNKASMIIPENTNAVRIMTIHASKGLEFPVVILPYCNWGVYKAGDDWVNIRNEKVNLPVSVVNLSKKAGESGFEPEVEAEKQEQLLDNLNLLYVAFTRAVERLHIISTQPEGYRQETVATWIESYLEENPVNRSDYEFTIGNAEPKQLKKEERHVGEFTLNKLEFNTRKDAIRIKASYLNNSEESEHAKKQGVLIHRLLSNIKTSGDIEKSLDSAAAEGVITSEEAPKYREKLQQITDHPSLITFFHENNISKLEAELVTQMGEVLRPDRVVFEPNQVTIIDYKTGQRQDEKYLKQLLKYETALMAMGHRKIKKLLVYTDEMVVVELK